MVSKLLKLRTKSFYAKKNLLLIFLLSLIATLLLSNLTPINAQLPRQEIRGVWMTTNDFNILKTFPNPLGLLRFAMSLRDTLRRTLPYSHQPLLSASLILNNY